MEALNREIEESVHVSCFHINMKAQKHMHVSMHIFHLVPTFTLPLHHNGKWSVDGILNSYVQLSG